MNYKLEVLHQSPKGVSTGKTLLFIHGVGHGAWCWEKYMDFFSKAGYDCYALSLRGHCGSKGHLFLNTFTIDDYVEDVYETVREIGGKPILVGHSMGGEITQKYLLKYQDTISGAVLLASSPAGGMRIWPDVLCMVPVAPQFLLCVLAMYGLIRSPKRIKNALFLDGRLSSGRRGRQVCAELLPGVSARNGLAGVFPLQTGKSGNPRACPRFRCRPLLPDESTKADGQSLQRGARHAPQHVSRHDARP